MVEQFTTKICGAPPKILVLVAARLFFSRNAPQEPVMIDCMSCKGSGTQMGGEGGCQLEDCDVCRGAGKLQDEVIVERRFWLGDRYRVVCSSCRHVDSVFQEDCMREQCANCGAPFH